MSPFSASKVKLVISFICCCHVILPVRSPFNCLCYSHGKLPKLTIQRRKHDLKRKKIQCHTNKYHNFSLSSSLVRFSNCPEPKRKTRLKQILDRQTLAFFARNNSKVQENAGKQVATVCCFFFEWSNLKAKLTKTNAISDHLLWKECRIIQYATDG